MAAKSAEPHAVTEIRRLASDVSRVRPTSRTKWDLLAQGLTTEDICDRIVAWIDAREPVKEKPIHSFPGFVGEPAYEMKPRINDTLFYIRVVLVRLGDPDEYMLLMAAHPDH